MSELDREKETDTQLHRHTDTQTCKQREGIGMRRERGRERDREREKKERESAIGVCLVIQLVFAFNKKNIHVSSGVSWCVGCANGSAVFLKHFKSQYIFLRQNKRGRLLDFFRAGCD